MTGGRRGLQVAVAVFGLVPVLAGLGGVLLGGSMTGASMVGAGGLALDSHVRYLSGLLLGIGLAYWGMIPRIEAHAGRFRLLTAIVALGGVSRLLGVAMVGVPPGSMLGGLGMELVVTPLLCLWQARVARGGGAAPGGVVRPGLRGLLPGGAGKR